MNNERMTTPKVKTIEAEKSVRQWSGQRPGRVIFPPHPTPLIGSIVQHLSSPIFSKQEKKHRRKMRVCSE